MLDWMDENPNDGAPWIGLVMVHAAHQRSGLAAEAIAGLANTAGERDGPACGKASSRGTTPGWRWHTLSACARSSASPHKIAAGERDLAVMEVAL